MSRSVRSLHDPIDGRDGRKWNGIEWMDGTRMGTMHGMDGMDGVDGVDGVDGMDGMDGMDGTMDGTLDGMD